MSRAIGERCKILAFWLPRAPPCDSYADSDLLALPVRLFHNSEPSGLSRATVTQFQLPRGDQQEDFENEAPCAQTICFAEARAR